MRRIFYLLSIVLIGFVMVFSVCQKEKLLSQGATFYLKLAPVDPRSLMQGDYMRLNYDINNRISEAEIQNKGFSYNAKAVLTLDSDGIASFSRLYKKGEALTDAEIKVNIIRTRRGGLLLGWQSASVAPSSFLFQEGLAPKYQNAKYAVLKADTGGSVLLAALADENRKEIK